ncbi:hypothetical protein BDW62DRAFT_157338 [Aspergillus aurantiobrunneus]
MHPQIVGSLALLGSLSLAAANDIVSLILPFADEQDLVGEVIGTDGPTTTYVLNCPDGTDAVDCGMPFGGMTIAAETTAFVYEYTFDDYYLRQSCQHSGTTWVSCEVTNTQSDFSTVTSAAESVELPYLPVTITATATDAGSDSEPTTTATSTTTAATNSESESSSITPSDSASITFQPSQSPSTTTDAEADAEETSSDNEAVAQVTGSAAQWLVSGAGMALALALA